MLSKTRLLFGAFCFIFSCLSFSSELSVKATSPTQKSEPSTRQSPQTQQEEENTEPLLTDKEYNEILNSLTPPPYDVFMNLVKDMDITSFKEYWEFWKEMETEGLPINPEKHYGNQWEGWPKKKLRASKNNDKAIEFAVNKIIALERGDFSYDNTLAQPHYSSNQTTYTNKRNNWMKFAEAKALMQTEGIKSTLEFREWKRAGKKPSNFPSEPHRVYKADWVSWPYFFGVEKTHFNNWMNFTEAQAFMQAEGIKSSLEFIEWKKAGKRPPNFPSNPDIKYKEYWKGWPHFLGTEGRRGRKGVSYKNWMPFAEAKALMKEQGIKTVKEFKIWKRAGKRPANFPGNPDVAYKEYWKGWIHFFGKRGKVDIEWMSYEEARAFMIEQGIKTVREFQIWKRAGHRPSNFPTNPNIKYKEDWVSWYHFFGTEKCKKAFK